MAKSKFVILKWETRRGPVRQKENQYSMTLNVYVGKQGGGKKDVPVEYHVNVMLDGRETEEQTQEKIMTALHEFEKKLTTIHK